MNNNNNNNNNNNHNHNHNHNHNKHNHNNKHNSNSYLQVVVAIQFPEFTINDVKMLVGEIIRDVVNVFFVFQLGQYLKRKLIKSISTAAAAVAEATAAARRRVNIACESGEK